ncbi:hypothetical protein ACFQGT_00465 [Natrialbaceae archaeon GCM10025810]
MALHRDPRERLDSIERELDRESIDPELRAEIEAELPDIYREYIALQSDKAFDQHLAKYVTNAYKERQQGKRKPLCTCSNPTCKLTNGKLPAKIRYNGDAILPQKSGRKRVLEYIHRHSGAEVLHEVLEAWDEREGTLHRDITRIHNQLLKDRQKELHEVPSQ